MTRSACGTCRGRCRPPISMPVPRSHWERAARLFCTSATIAAPSPPTRLAPPAQRGQQLIHASRAGIFLDATEVTKPALLREGDARSSLRFCAAAEPVAGRLHSPVERKDGVAFDAVDPGAEAAHLFGRAPQLRDQARVLHQCLFR